MKEHKLDNLPEWAKQEIGRLRVEVAYYKSKAQEIKGDKKTNTYISQMMDEPLPLPNNSHIIFVTNPNSSITTGQIQGRIKEDNSIEIYGDKQLNIRLHSSNICHIEQKEFRG